MTRTIRGQRGMSLVEATIILMVLSVLTAVFAPSMGDYVNDAKNVKAKEDVEALGGGLERLIRDTGVPFPLIDPQAAIANRYKKVNRADILVTAGDIPSLIVANHANYTVDSNEGAPGDLNWDTADSSGTRVDRIDKHLVSNTSGAGYLLPTFPLIDGSGGPHFGVGWRGAYVSSLSSDPWGKRYAVNTIFMGGASDATAKGWNFDVAVFCAGPNGTVDSNFNQNGFSAGIDDVVYVIQGSTR